MSLEETDRLAQRHKALQGGRDDNFLPRTSHKEEDCLCLCGETISDCSQTTSLYFQVRGGNTFNPNNTCRCCLAHIVYSSSEIYSLRLTAVSMHAGKHSQLLEPSVWLFAVVCEFCLPYLCRVGYVYIHRNSVCDQANKEYLTLQL